LHHYQSLPVAKWLKLNLFPKPKKLLITKTVPKKIVNPASDVKTKKRTVPASININNDETVLPPTNVIDVMEPVTISQPVITPTIEETVEINASIANDLADKFVAEFNDIVQEVIDKIVSPVFKCCKSN
jgi:hypothetical protein